MLTVEDPATQAELIAYENEDAKRLLAQLGSNLESPEALRIVKRFLRAH